MIETCAYNDDGTAILNEVNIRSKKYGEAMRILLDVIISKGYLVEDGLVSVSVQAGGNSGNDMLEWLEQVIAASLTEHHDQSNGNGNGNGNGSGGHPPCI